MPRLKAIIYTEADASMPDSVAPSPPPPRRHRGNNGIHHHPPGVKALAIAAAAAGSSSDDASAISGVPARTIRGWVQDIERMGPSELDALVAEKTRIIRGLWAHWGVECFEFAAELRAIGDAKGLLHVMTAAGICDTKLTGNQPDKGRFGSARQVEGVVSSSTSSPSTLLDRLNPPNPPADPSPPLPEG